MSCIIRHLYIKLTERFQCLHLGCPNYHRHIYLSQPLSHTELKSARDYAQSLEVQAALQKRIVELEKGTKKARPGPPSRATIRRIQSDSIVALTEKKALPPTSLSSPARPPQPFASSSSFEQSPPSTPSKPPQLEKSTSNHRLLAPFPLLGVSLPRPTSDLDESDSNWAPYQNIIHVVGFTEVRARFSLL